MADYKAIVSIAWPHQPDAWREVSTASQRGIDIKNWLVSEGLVMYVDFEWRLNTQRRTIDITFFKDTLHSTLLALKFQGQ